MLRPGINLIVAVGTSLCLLAGNASGKPVVVHKNHNRGYMIAPSPRPAVVVRPYSRMIPGRHLFHRIGPKRTHRPLVIVRTPYGQIIKAFPAPRVGPHDGVVKRMIVRVWFINSNGSRTGVELLRRGPGFIGPRSEWYREIPTQRQLWIAYGF